MSDTLVLPILHAPKVLYEVERVSGSWSPHIPEKLPSYTINVGRGGWFNPRGEALKLQVVRLAQARQHTYVLVELPARRSQWCVKDGGFWHGVLFSENPMSATTYCERNPYIGFEVEKQQESWGQHVPDCPTCKSFKTAWVCLMVYPYEEKRKVVKKTDREAALKKRRAKMPTAYDRILSDDFLEKPTYKPEPVQQPLPELDPFAQYEKDERLRKLEAARERSLRFKSARR
jgi:hypothetical protein